MMPHLDCCDCVGKLHDKINKLTEALEYYANPKSWEYTDCGGQFTWNSTIKNDVSLNPEVDEGGGTDYAGKRAREALGVK
jgi:hypothetical protein